MRILRNLTRHSTSTAVAISEPLVALLGDRNNEGDNALGALAKIAVSPHGAECALAAKVLEAVAERLVLPDIETRCGPFKLLGELVKHECAVDAVLTLMPCFNNDVPHRATAAFSTCKIPRSPDVAEATFAAVMYFIKQELESMDLGMSACLLLKKIAEHECTSAAILQLNIGD
ncbi:hypothetical protein FB451DRAFT_1243484 [Mycena latifolia]|nr:hypothetical protein FB451DRAFT_1243484 [Mycena latifolia]